MTSIILAFSGGLDTTFCIPYLKEEGYDVITATVNTGGFTKKELIEIAEKSKTLGASEHFQLDAEDELYDHYVTKIIQGNYLRGGSYPACVGPERIVAAKAIAELAKEKNITAVAHGSTGAGNDQVRFDLVLKALIPGVTIIAPIRDKGLTRAQEIQYLQEKGIEVPAGAKDYSINIGVLGTTIGGKETTGTMGLPPEEVYPSVTPLKNTPDAPAEITITFKEGMPVALNGEALSSVQFIQKIKALADKHGIGKGSHLGTTILGIKGRIAFEAAAMSVLIDAHKELEKSVLTSKQIFWKDHLATVWGDMIHEGLAFDPLIQDIEAFIGSSQKFVSGEVKVQLFKGNIIPIGSTSEYSLLDTSLGVYGEENSLWDGKDAAGFCKIYGLEGVIAHQKHNLK
jgi:argininosuccinate synthase